MKGRLACLLVLNLLCMTATVVPLAHADTGNSGWRNVGVDPATWLEGPDPEETPMKDTYQGNAIVEIEVSYVPAHFTSRAYGVIVIELFEAWAPITTENMITNVEDGIYDGIFFHRVIDDFVIQGGDPSCSTVGFYPVTNPQCGNGGTGDTIPLERNPNLSHVDGAIGMARGQDPDSADAQWYIAETEAHNLDPENRDDEGYATFGIVRDGMSHVRGIALTPTSDDPTGEEDIQNPASSAGRPSYEAEIISVRMVGVSDPDGTVRFGDGLEDDTTSWLSTLGDAFAVIGLSLGAVLLLAFAGFLVFYVGRIDAPLGLDSASSAPVYDAVLIDDPPPK
ncbi:MAG: peptidylprolyl isomerase [Candidatus Poseidoniaceae archaeon]|jgi:cyclophilin family peptidyl-prolyl cis-trans isomerase|tara:strand:+ start:7479 stop:8489 length:1011 start_codon:yes stop_codon:yes gene_type:complete